MKLVYALFLGFMMGFQLAVGPADAAQETRYAAVTFYADWCGACKILDPKIQEARSGQEFSDVQFYTFDMTDRQSIDQTKALAESEKLNDVLLKYGSVTGFMVLYDRQSGEIVQTVTSAYSAKDIAKLLQGLNQAAG